MADDLGCRIDSFPITYLGVPLGGKIFDVNGWDHVVDLFRSKLVMWKSCHLSMGGRLTLIKSMVCSILIYSLSVRILATRVKNILQGLMGRFLWGGSEDRSEMYLIDWNSVSCSFKMVVWVFLISLISGSLVILIKGIICREWWFAVKVDLILPPCFPSISTSSRKFTLYNCLGS